MHPRVHERVPERRMPTRTHVRTYRYDAFFSYSHVPAFDEPFTERLADCLGVDGLRPFLDKRSLQRGEALDLSCLLAMANSRVVVPVVTWNALRRMTTLTAASTVDYLLLEWSFALLLKEEHGVAVLPVFIGARDDDGTADPTVDLFKARPPRASADGWGNAADASGALRRDDDRSVFARVPDVLVGSVLERLEGFYSKQNLPLPEHARGLTARRVVEGIAAIHGEATASTHATATPNSADFQRHWGLEQDVAEKVVATVRAVERAAATGGAARPAVFARNAHAAGVDAVFRELLDGQRRLEEGQKRASLRNQEVLDRQRRASEARKRDHAELMASQRQIQAAIHDLHTSVSANSTMLSTLLQSEHDCPRWLIVVPKPPPASKARRAYEWLHPKSWVGKSMLLFFVCPVTMDTVGEGFELTMQKEWVREYGPAIRVGLSILRLGVGVAKLAGVPLPSVGAAGQEMLDTLEARASLISEMCEGVREELEGAGLGEVSKWAADKLDGVKKETIAAATAKGVDGMPAPTREAIQHSYTQVATLLASLCQRTGGGKSIPALLADPKRCGLAKAVCAADGSTEWVASKWRGDYERHGRSLLGLDDDGRARLLASGAQTVASTPPAVMQKSKSTLRGLLGSMSAKGSAKGSTKSANVEVDPLTTSLCELLGPLKLDGTLGLMGSTKVPSSKLDLARAWCEESGATDLGDIMAMDNADKVEFVEALGLKRIKAKELCRKLQVDETLINLLDIKLKAK